MFSSMTTVTGVTNLTVGGSSSAIITHEYNSSTELHKINVTLSTLTIASNGQINVTGDGYSGNNGPGHAVGGNGAGHGGQGGSTGTPGPTYDSYSVPVNIGSGSSCGTRCTSGAVEPSS